MDKKLQNIEFILNGDAYLKIKRTNPDSELYDVKVGVINLTKAEANSLYSFLKKALEKTNE